MKLCIQTSSFAAEVPPNVLSRLRNSAAEESPDNAERRTT